MARAGNDFIQPETKGKPLPEDLKRKVQSRQDKARGPRGVGDDAGKNARKSIKNRWKKYGRNKPLRQWVEEQAELGDADAQEWLKNKEAS